MRRITFFRRLIRVFAPLAGVMLILIALPSFISPKPLPGGFRRQALALELVRNPDDIEQITRVYPPPEVN